MPKYEVALSEAYFPAQEDREAREITVGGLLRETAARRPSAEALVEVRQSGEIGRRWSYAALLAESERLALALASRFRPGERVVVWSPNSPEWVLMEYACALAGLVLVTANPAYQVRELRYVLEQSGAVALFLVDEYRGNPMAEIGAQAVDGLGVIREVVDMNDAAALHAVAGSAAAQALPDVSPGDAAQIQYTSGTTGFPKGAVLSHRGLVNNARYHAGRCGVTERTTWINPMPMFHTSGCGMLTLGSLQAGCRMILMSLFDPHVIVDLIETQKAAIALGVPTMILAMLDAYDASPRDVSTLELVSSGGAMVAPGLVRRVQRTFGCAFSTLYGQTEHSPVITQHHSDDSIDDICNTVGQAVPQTEVSIRRLGDNRAADIGEVGEICARSACVMLGYHDDAASTAEAIDPQGWLHTGDLGLMDARGYVTITGRVKEMIIRGGENHFPAEIENVLLEHASVAEISVVGLPDETWGEVIAAFVRTEGGRELDRDALHAHCRASLSPQKTPTVWCQVDAFPMTGSARSKSSSCERAFCGAVPRGAAMTATVLYERDGRIGRITLNRPEVLNAIDGDLPGALSDAVARADADPAVHVMVLSGAGRAFCAGYDLTHYASGDTGGGDGEYVGQEMPWDPIQDYAFMWANTQHFMALWRALKPVICKVHGLALAGGSDIALCADLTLMAEDAEIGYMPARVWGCPRPFPAPRDRHVGLPLGAREGEAHALHRRQDHR